MSIAAYLAKLSEGVTSSGILSTSKGGTGTTSGGAFPTITGISYGGDGNDTATDTSGGKTITITGANFAANATILINGVAAPVVTVVSPSTITFTTPAMAAGTYVLYMVNADGSTAIAVPGISYSGVPVWSTAAGTVATAYETQAVSASLGVTSNSTVTLSLLSGALPPGAVFNSNGTISGTSAVVSGPTTYTFTVRATDAELQDTDRQFSIVINPDIINWTYPANSSTVTINQNENNSISIAATSVVGNAVTNFTADTLPPGMALAGSTISGVPTTLGNTSTTLSGTTVNTQKTGTATFTWSVIVGGDVYRKNTTLLLTGTTPGTPNFVTNYANNNSLTPAGNTRPSNFNPYTPGYYSNQFNLNNTNTDSLQYTKTGGWLTSGNNFTIEFWACLTNYSSVGLGYPVATSGLTNGWESGFGGTASSWTSYGFSFKNAGGSTTATQTFNLGQWYHIAIVKNSSTMTIYVDGVSKATAAAPSTWTDNTTVTIGQTAQSSYNYWFPGHVSNLRIVDGTAVYTSNFIPSAAPLTAITNTVLLTCQSNRYIDNSSINATPSRAGATLKVSSFNPFTPNASYSTYGSAWFFTNGGAANSDYIGGYTSPALGTQDHTIEFWYYNDGALQTYGNPWTYNGPATQQATNNYYISIGASGSGVVLGGGGTWAVNMAFTTPPINAWSHIAVTRSGSTFRIFVNGVQAATATSAQTITAPNGQMLLGTYAVGAANGNWINGYVSDFRYTIGTALYTANFTPPTQPLPVVTGTQILSLQTNQALNNNAFIDNSGNALAITRNGNATQGTFSPYGANWSGYFNNSTSDNIVATSNANFAIGTSNFTVEAFVNFSAWTGTQRLFLQGVSGTDGITIGRPNTNNLEVGINTVTVITYAWTPNIGQWYHIALVRTGTGSGQVALYIDGVSVATGTSAASVAQNQVVVGGLSWAASYNLQGYMSNVRYSNIARTITVPTVPYTADANTLLLTCQNNSFIDNSPYNNTITRNGSAATQTFSPFPALTETPTSYSNLFNQGGVGGYLTVADNANLRIGTNPFTIECWVHLTLLAGNPRLIQKRTYNATGGGTWSLYVGADGAVIFTELATPSTLITTAAGALAINNWYHVALTRDSSNVLRLFINGVSSGTTSPASTFNFNDAANAIFIGADNDAVNTKTQGSMSNVRLVIGSAIYTSNFTPNTAPLTAVSGTQLLTCQSNIVKDNSTNNFAITQVGTSSFQVRKFNPFGYTTSARQEYSPATFGGSAYFDGSGDFLTHPGNVGFNLSGVPFTVECWFYQTSSKTAQLISLGAAVWRLNVTSSQVIDYVFGGTSVASSNNTTPLNQWNHVAICHTGTAHILFLNGIRQTVSGSLFPPSDSTTTLYVGRNIDAGAGWDFPGYITDVHVVRGRALYSTNFLPPQAPVTPVANTQLLLNMNDIGIADYNRSVNLETVGDTKIVPESAYNGLYYSNYFDGTGDYLTTPSNIAFGFGSGDFTIEGWFNFTGTISTYQRPWWFGDDNDNLEINASVIRYGGAALTVVTGSTVVASTWYHIAYSRQSGNGRLFINGTQVGSTTANSYSSSTRTLTLMATSTGVNPSAGYVSNFRVVKGTALYTANFTPSTTLLTAVTGTSLLTCQSNKFKDTSTNDFALTKAGDVAVRSFNPFQRNTNTSMYFDGTGDWLTAPASINNTVGGGAFTVECWVHISGAQTQTYGHTLAGTYPGTGNGWVLLVNRSNGGPLGIAWANGTPTSTQLTYNTYLDTGRWYHIAVVRTSTAANGLKFYLDGVNVATGTDATNDTVVQTLYIAGGNTVFGGGYVEDFRITKGVARYTGNFAVPTAKLTIK